MPQYPVQAQCFLGGQLYHVGDIVTMKADAAEDLLARGTLGEALPAKRGRPPGSGKRSAWTPADDSDSDDD